MTSLGKKRRLKSHLKIYQIHAMIHIGPIIMLFLIGNFAFKLDTGDPKAEMTILLHTFSQANWQHTKKFRCFFTSRLKYPRLDMGGCSLHCTKDGEGLYFHVLFYVEANNSALSVHKRWIRISFLIKVQGEVNFSSHSAISFNRIRVLKKRH